MLDSHDIDVKQILVDDVPLKFDIRPFTKYGSALHISLPESLRRRDELTLVITFVAGSGNAFDWLKKEQTAGREHTYIPRGPRGPRAAAGLFRVHSLVVGKKLPYLYTQGQSVLNRTFFPCFDSPAIKCTWSAKVRVRHLTTLLSS